jgi:hypothetical protein
VVDRTICMPDRAGKREGHSGCEFGSGGLRKCHHATASIVQLSGASPLPCLRVIAPDRGFTLANIDTAPAGTTRTLGGKSFFLAFRFLFNLPLALVKSVELVKLSRLLGFVGIAGLLCL